MLHPFAHEDLELKQGFLKLARDFYQKAKQHETLENALAAALLYMNLADYLAEYLVLGLEQMSKEAMGKYYLGVVTKKSPVAGNFNIGNSIKRLKVFQFPQKDDVIEVLEQVNKARIMVAHGIFKTRATHIEQVDLALETLVQHTETLVDLVDEISLGMPPQTILDKLQANPTAAGEYPNDKHRATKIYERKNGEKPITKKSHKK